MAAEASDKETRSGELFDCKLKCDMQMDPKCFIGPMDFRGGGGGVTDMAAIVHMNWLGTG